MKASRVVLELPSRRGNPRNSEGAFVALRDGRILFAYTKFTSGWHDYSAAVIATRTSDDGGATWGRRDSILVKDEGSENVMSVSLLRLGDGRIALFYLVKRGDCRLRMRTSADEGRTWSRPVWATPSVGYYVVNNDRVVQLRDGRLVVPAAFHRRFAADMNRYSSLDPRGIAVYFLSDDGGRTWREGRSWRAMPAESGCGLQEPGVVELADGRLLSWCRTDLGCQYAMVSLDRGESWSLPMPAAFASPCSPMSVKRIEATGDLLAIWNDHSGRFPVPKPDGSNRRRTPLVSAISRDEANTWRNHKRIEAAPDGFFCYTAIHFPDDKHVLLAYSAGRNKTGFDRSALRVIRLPVAWFQS